MSNQDINHNNDDSSKIEDAFNEALRMFGYLFPETEEELDNLKKKFAKSTLEIPEDIDDPLKIIERGKITVISDFNSSQDAIVEENLAMAARDGGEISEDVLKQMEKDRIEAENKAKKKGDAD